MNFPKDMQNDLKVNNKKSFNIVLNSNDAIDGGTTGQKTFRFDWYVLPDVPYLIKFSYIGGLDDSSTASDNYCNVYINFGTPTNTYSSSNNYGASSNSCIGSLQLKYFNYDLAGVIGTKQYFYSGCNDNTPIYINGRPTNTDFTVRFLTGTGTIWNTTLINQGTLILYFEPV